MFQNKLLFNYRIEYILFELENLSFEISVVVNLNIQMVPNKKCQLIASKIRIAPDFIGWVKKLVQMKSWNLFKGIYDE